MKQTSANIFPITALVLFAVISIAACYYVTIYQGAVPVLENEEVR